MTENRLGVIAVAVGLATPAYVRHGLGVGSFETFGAAVALVVVAACAGVAVVLTAAFERSSAVPIATVVWATWLALAGLVAAAVRLGERPDHVSGLAVGSYLQLGGCVALVVGCWLAMRDERTDLYRPVEVEQRKPPKPADT